MASMSQPAAVSPQPGAFRLPYVIGASAIGTVIEWYDFYLYGVLAAFFSTQFFPPGNDTAALLASLATFGAGFAVRPFGAAFFGRIGDITGRKFTFLLTITVMGISTAMVGVLPTYAQIGILAPIILVTLRLAQGLALGGEYGGAAIYVAEHSRDAERGKQTSWIQTTATLGLLLALVVIGITRGSMSAEEFTAWGWRIPFLLSVVLVAVAIFIRIRLQETPLFSRLKAAGRSSTAPWRDSFGDSGNRKLILLALFGATAGQAVVWYQGQFQALFFMGTVLGVKYTDAYLIVGSAIVLGTPFFLLFGRLSDRIGRKPIILGGCAIAALTYFPIYNLMTQFAHPQGTLSTAGTHVGKFVGPDGLPTVAQPDILPLIALVWIQIVYVAMVYGPIAAFLVEFFPGQDPVHLAFHPVPHREWLVRWLPATDLRRPPGCDRKPLRGTDLPDQHRRDDGDRRRTLDPGESPRPDLGRGRRRDDRPRCGGGRIQGGRARAGDLRRRARQARPRV